MKLLWVFKVSNCDVAYAIGAEFHHVNLKVTRFYWYIYFNYFLFYFVFFYEG